MDSTHDYMFREARPQDVPEIERILRAAATRMMAEGKKQWDENYPTRAHVLADMDAHAAYVLEAQGRVLAYGAVVFAGEPAYADLRGRWLTDGDYVVLHRMAVAQDEQRHGLARRFLESVERLSRSRGVGSFRVDTNFDNDRMLRLLRAQGFAYCGKITYPSGERQAYEKPL